MNRPPTYVERAPIAQLAAVVRTVWIQRVGARHVLQRHLPTGGMELLYPVGGVPRLIDPLTQVKVEVLAPGTETVGVRFWPGAATGFLTVPPGELVDEVVSLEDVDWTSPELMSCPREGSAAEDILLFVQRGLLRQGARTQGPDALVAAAVQRLMPWQPTTVVSLADDLSISESQLRRRFRTGVGFGPKVLQRILRLQGYLALAQASERADRVSDFAAELGYADHAHLSRECVRLTGQTPSQLLGDARGRCACEHDHLASYKPFLMHRRDTPLLAHIDGTRPRPRLPRSGHPASL